MLANVRAELEGSLIRAHGAAARNFDCSFVEEAQRSVPDSIRASQPWPQLATYTAGPRQTLPCGLEARDA